MTTNKWNGFGGRQARNANGAVFKWAVVVNTLICKGERKAWVLAFDLLKGEYVRYMCRVERADVYLGPHLVLVQYSCTSIPLG